MAVYWWEILRVGGFLLWGGESWGGWDGLVGGVVGVFVMGDDGWEERVVGGGDVVVVVEEDGS